MSNAVSDLESVGVPPSPPPTGRSTATSTAKKLIQAAALAAVLVPLGSVAVETATLNCVSDSSGSCIGSFSTGSGSNIWKFFPDSTFTPEELIYTFSITGTPTSTFSLDVSDEVVTQSFLDDVGDMENFPGYTCIPTFDDAAETPLCGLFDVFEVEGTASWLDGYTVEITWFATNSLGQPLNDFFNTILQATNASEGQVTFDNELAQIIYQQSPTPTDPAISGKGSGFSRFGAFRNEDAAAAVPEPASLVMLGTGLVGLAYRARRRRRP